jgi:hypothetical protein
MSPAEQLLNRAYSAANNPQTFTQKEAGLGAWIKKFTRSKAIRGGAKETGDFLDDISKTRAAGVAAVPAFSIWGGVNYSGKLDRPEEEPVDFSEADKSEESLGTASLAALGGAGGGLASVVYGKLADKPNLQRDLIAALTGTAIGAAVGSTS